MAGLFDLDGGVALVTGASGGLGRHFALTLAKAGARVAVGARRAAELQETVDLIGAAGGSALPVELDVANAAQGREAVKLVVERWGRIDVLVNNAGIIATGPALELSEAEWDQVVDTNLKGAWLMAQAVGRSMVGRGGAIINIASILGLRVAGEVSAYAASKAALIHLTHTLAFELARHKIRVNAIAPGYIETDMNRAFFATEAGQALIKRIPQRRLGTAEDLDGALLLLASPASAYMTGAVIAVDGGHLYSSL
jgi:NAD(P)-dependent dehydrogenase (short-subunit alcohol dehydrogenase family)